MSSRRRVSGSVQLRKWLVFAPLLLAVGCSATEQSISAPVVGKSPAAEQAVAQQHVVAAQKLADEQNYDAAIDEYTEALAVMRAQSRVVATESVDADVLFQRGVAYLKQGFPDTAAADFSEVLRMRPDFGPAYAKRGEAYAKLGDLYKAVRDCTDAMRYEPECAVAYRYRGQCYVARGQFDRAVADLDQAVTIDPTLTSELKPLEARAYRLWGEQLERAGDPTEAEAKFALARALDPNYVAPAATGALAEATDEAVKLTAAKQVIDRAQESYERGLAQLAQRNFEQALIEFSAAIDDRADFTDAYLRRAETLLALNFPDTAVKDLDQALRYDGESVEAYQLQTRAFLALGSQYRALQAATDALHADPTNGASYVLRGIAYVNLGNWERAIIDLEQAVRLDNSLADDAHPALERAYALRDAAQVRATPPAPATS
jgi:tetratricopeptide (TPR) repeat protein